MQKGNILVVEDSPATSKLIEIKLLEEGFNVVTTTNAVEALDKLWDFSPDLIIADVMMPDMDGFDFLKKVRSEMFRSDIPFILLSAKSSVEDKVRGFELGTDDYVTKPFQIKELIARIKTNLDRSERIRKESSTDFLTGMLNRRAMDNRLKVELHRSRRFGRVFSMAMIDIDHFKELNDTNGHLIGDDVLRSVAKTIQSYLRDIDIVARYGGEEFLVIMPETERDNACQAMERIRKEIAERRLFTSEGKTVGTTVSAGVSQFPEDGMEAETLIRAADTAMYQSKSDGRNRVTVYNGSSEVAFKERSH